MIFSGILTYTKTMTKSFIISAYNDVSLRNVNRDYMKHGLSKC